MTGTTNDAPDDRRSLDRDAVERMVAAIVPEWTVERARTSDEGSEYVCFVTADAPDGRREGVLKACSGDVDPPTVFRTEPRIMEVLAARTEIPVPEVYGVVDEHSTLPAPFFLTERLPGDNGAHRFEDLSTTALEHVLADAGRNLAALHDVRSFDRFGRVGVVDGELAVVDDESERATDWAGWLRADVDDVLDALADDDRFADLVPDVRAHVDETLAALDGPDEGVLVHWDYRLGNLLIDAATGRTTGVLDWAGVVAGDPVYNLATVEDHNVNWQTQDVDLRRRLRERFLDAYDAHADRDRSAEFHERKRLYHLCHRLNAMACLDDWYADASDERRDERVALHRAYVRDALD